MRWVVVCVLVLVAGCSSGSGGSPAEPPRVSVTPSPSVVVDANARAACSQLAEARALHAAGKTESPVGGYGTSTSEMQAMGAEVKALDLALKSSVPEVHRIGLDAGPVSALRSWCEQNAG